MEENKSSAQKTNDSGNDNEIEDRRYIKEITEIVKSVGIAVITALVTIVFIFETVTVEGKSMQPTLKGRDRLIVEKVTYYLDSPRRDDIIVFKYPANPAKKFIKRIEAVEGDRIKIENNKLFINGKVKEEPYILEETMSDFAEVTVPKDTVFVLGDNRNNSRDSRNKDVGFVSIKLIVGRAVYRIFPFNMIGRIR